MKLIRCFIVFVVVSFILGVGSAFNGSTENVENVNDVSTKVVDKNDDEIVQSTYSVEKEEITPVTEEEKLIDNQKQVDIASEKKSSENKKEVKTNQNLTSEKRGDEETKQIIVQENVEQKQEIEQEKVVLQEESNVVEQIIVEEKKEEIKEDNEYETLLKQVEYSTFDECMEIGFEEAIKDPIGILGFSCPYIAYKGEIIGYRLQLDYTNPMEN